MTKTRAIKEASRHVSIIGRGTSWHIYGPYRVAQPSGPSTECTADSYAKAVRIRSEWRAEIALAMMGRLGDEASFAINMAMNDPYADHSMRALVEAGLRASDCPARRP